jgi:aminoglycoside 6'-N-acetyltransferase I
MDASVELVKEEESYIIKNLYPLYLHDLAEIYGHYPNEHGIFEESNQYRTLNDQYDVQNIWFQKPDSLFPYLIRVDGRPAGFMLISSPPYCNKGIDYFVHEAFLLRPFRGKGIAEYTAAKLFERYKGKWELFTNPSTETNKRGQQFWRKTIGNYTNDNFVEEFKETFDGYKLIFRLENTIG